MDEVIIEWRIVSNATDVNFAVQKSREVQATSVMLLFNVSFLTNIAGITAAVQAYVQAGGFKIYPCVGAARMLTPADIDPLLALPITGIAIDLSGTYTKEEGEAGLVALAQACKNAGKTFAYYHGDGMSGVDAVKMAQAGCIVWAWWTGSWKPGTWNLPNIWAQTCIWRNRADHADSTYASIVDWYNSLPRRPEALMYWQTTCVENPSDEQVQALREISGKYLGTTPPPPPPHGWTWPLLTWLQNLIEKRRG